ncbi:MAG: putative polysaccharide biosynthesis protein [Bacillota bacterium]
MNDQQYHELIKGTFWLSSAGLISRIIGAAYRIPLNRFFGPEIMGMYQMAYPLFQLLVMLSIFGFPTALARLVAREKGAGRNKKAHDYFISAFFLLGSTGALFSVLLYLGSDYYAEKVADTPDIGLAIELLSPAIFFVFLITAFRGFFQGMQNMFPFASSQIVEQVVKVIFALFFGFMLIEALPAVTLGGIMLGTTIGAFCGLLAMVYYYFIFINREYDHEKLEPLSFHRFKKNTRELLISALPITIGGIMMPLMRIIDVALVTRRLELIEGITALQVRSLYGYLTSYAGTVANLPEVFAISLSASLVPAVACLYNSENSSKPVSPVEKSLKLAFVFSAASAVGLLIFAREVNLLLFNDAGATMPLQIRSTGIVFLSLSYICVGALHGIGKTKIPLLGLSTGMLVQFIITYFLTPIPEININGAALGRVSGYCITFLINFKYVSRYLAGSFFSLPFFLKTLFALFTMAAGSLSVYELILALTGLSGVALTVAIFTGAAIYIFILLRLKLFSYHDIITIPRYGEKIAHYFYKKE